MKKYIMYIVVGVIVAALALVVAWKSSEGRNVTFDENPESEYTEEEEIVSDDEDESVDDRYAESNIEADDEGYEWNWRLLETEKIYDDGFYLLRDDKIYSLNKTNVSENKLSGKGYLCDRVRNDNKNTKQDIILALSYVPTPVVKPGDLVVGYSETSVPDLVLQKVSFHGWTIGAYNTTEDNHASPAVYYDDEYNRREDGAGSVISDFIVYDQDGNVVDDPYNLNAYEPYTARWYMGTRSEGNIFDATCRAFTIDDEEYVVRGSLTDKDYAEYDLSEVPAGTYLVLKNSKGFGGGGLITIE